MIYQLINDEKFTNIQNAQAGLTKLFLKAKEKSHFYRVLKNDQPLGVIIPEDMWLNITEDLEALSSPSYRTKIANARKIKKTIPLKSVKKILEI
jgi:PHD/YefM family antitoxin component YafN of YafNO toxin-antitoxin module